MNEEVKDLLNDLKKNNEHKKQQGYSKCFPDYYSLNYEDLDLLLNYIFNLQNRIDNALNFIDCHFKEMVADEEAQKLKSILKESGE